ncbi:acyltransferase family protein [Burkholderia cepacia]|uniref:acyltransferase family protein n=1 Tax=Burkholderia cepacia TaxID=292 RepID=UPI0009BF24AB|nr:acyltransferase family protein [Burkholderia cepacia]
MDLLRGGVGSEPTPGTLYASKSHSFPRNSTADYRRDIDGLRAVSVLAVLLFHAFPALLPGGFVGVDVFFVISGYVITKHALRELDAGTFSFSGFYARRIRRIFPALLLVFVGLYAFGWQTMLPEEFKQLGKHIAGGAGSVANLVFWHEAGYFDVSAEQKPLLHLWSLGVEEQFYLVWPVLLVGAWRLRSSPFWPIAIVGLGSFLMSVLTLSHDPVGAFYSPLTRAWEPMLGAFLAVRHHTAGERLPSIASANVKAGIGIALLAASVALIDPSLPFPGGLALGPTVAAYLLIDAGSRSPLAQRVLGGRPLVTIGLISYPLYLFHWPLLSALRIMSSGTTPALSRALALLACFPLAFLTYRYIETPIRKSRYPRLTVSTLIVLMAGCAFAGYNDYSRGGLEFRMSRLVGAFADGVDFDRDRIWRRGQCYLEGDDRGFSPACVDGGSGPVVMLWGDSRAAALSPGLRSASAERGIRFAQLSTSGCPPLIDGGSERCRDSNARVLELVHTVKPATVLLTANWSSDRLQALPGTIGALRAAGVKRIVLIGQVATWQSALPKLYWLYWREHHQTLPSRTDFGLDPASKRYDREGAAMASQLGIEYVSAFDAMCDARGCITRAGIGRGSIVMFDDSHLTPQGAVAVSDRIASTLFGK